MADIRLVKPQANTAQTISCAADSRFVLEFPSDAALFARDGDDLVLTFEDGSSIRLQDFYTTYSKEEMPSFEMEGAEISGEDFFAALGNPDLMPAAGPTAAAAQGNSSFNVYGDAALLGGIDRLDGLDISFNFGQQTQDDLYASIGRDDDEGVVDHGVTVTPSEPGTLDPEIPVKPHRPGSEGGLPDNFDRDILRVDEANLSEGTQPSPNGVAQASGSMQISAPDGVNRIEVDGVVVYENGRLTNDMIYTHDGEKEGYLQVTGYDATTGRLTYTYTLVEATQEHNEKGPDDAIAHEMLVTVTDSDGDTGSGVIRVEITDDGPILESVSVEAEQIKDTDSVINGQFEGLNIGADSEGASITVEVNGTTFVGTRNEDGDWVFSEENDGSSFTLNPDGTFTYTRPTADIQNPGEDSYKFAVTVTDGDDDTVSQASAVVTTSPVTTDSSATISSVEVEEEALASSAVASESIVIDTNNQSTTVVIGDVTLEFNASGELVSATQNGSPVELEAIAISGDKGNGTLTLTNTAFNEGKLTIDYTYTLNESSQEHKNPDGQDNISSKDVQETFAVSVNGVKQQSGITATIVDDIVGLNEVTVDVPEGGINDNTSKLTGTLEGLKTSEDGTTIVVEVIGKDETSLGTFTATQAEDGSWTFTPETAEDGSSFTLNPPIPMSLTSL